jgi:hypothetical protein
MVRIFRLSTVGIFFLGWIGGCLFVLTFLINGMKNNDDFSNKTQSLTPRLRSRESEGNKVYDDCFLNLVAP